MDKIVLTTTKELEQLLMDALHRFGLKPEAKHNPTFSINQVAKKLGMAHSTIKKLVLNGIIKSTTNGRISREAIEDYLAGK